VIEAVHVHMNPRVIVIGPPSTLERINHSASRRGTAVGGALMGASAGRITIRVAFKCTCTAAITVSITITGP
jgi:hypothetical protein